MQPRPYQNECCDAIWNYFAQGNRGNPFVAMPTGTGKSLIPAMIMLRALMMDPGQRMLILTHVKELVEQNYNQMLRLWPYAPAGICAASLDRRDVGAPLLFGSIQTVQNLIWQIGHRDLLFIDEGHLLSPNAASMYRTIIDMLLQINPWMRVIGLSATPFRMGQGMIIDPTYHKGQLIQPIFTDMVYDITGLDAFNQLIDDYYLSTLVPRQTTVQIDVSDVREMSTGDYSIADLDATMRKQNIVKRALEESMELSRDRKSWIVFGAGIENVEQIATELNRIGILTCYVHSKMNQEDRDKAIKGFKAGYYRAIVSNNILTTGFDHPQVDNIIDLRPTISVVLHLQKYGRGTRPYYAPWFTFDMLQYKEYRKQAMDEGGKRNCQVLDYAGNTARLGPINDPRIPKAKGKGGGDIPVKICPHLDCNAFNHISARICCGCGREFIFRVKIKQTASTDEIIRKSEPQIEIVQVDESLAVVHAKPGKTKKLRIQYHCGLRMFNAYLGFEPDEKGYPKHQAHNWWRKHHDSEPPINVDEAYKLFPQCRRATHLRVDTGGEWPEILDYLFV